jgi:D-alanine--poly(phosphoribitol) ligase subunit 1
MYQSFPTILAGSINLNQEHHALWIKNGFYSYAELGKKINGITRVLQKIPSNAGLIGIYTEDNLETYASILAIWLTGKGFVPISPSFPDERCRQIVEQSGIQWIIMSGRKECYPHWTQSVQVVETAGLNGHDGQVQLLNTKADNEIACMLFTSGSTGVPKGVPMTYSNINATLDSYRALGYGPGPSDRCLQMFEFTFDMSLIAYLPAFLSGACVYSIVDDKFKFMTAFKVIGEHALTFSVFVPSTLAFMQKYFNSFHFSQMHHCLVGGEPFPVELATKWQQCVPNCLIVNISGPTETTMACMGYEVPKQPDNQKHYKGILAFGKPWKNTRAIVVDASLEPVMAGQKGELCFSGNHVMQGYWKDSEKNKMVLFTRKINGGQVVFYRTGDSAFVDDEGDFYTCGRIDFQIKIQGYRVEPGEVEAVANGFVKDGLAIAVPYKKYEGFNALHLFVEKGKVHTGTLMERLKEKLPPYMVPDGITEMDHFPLNINGKIDKLRLKKKLEEDGTQR